MMKRVYFLHTVSTLQPLFNELSEELLPHATWAHIADDSLIHRILAEGGLTPAIENRLLENIRAAESAGADFIQVTCSSLTPAVLSLRSQVQVPLLSIDEPVAKRMVEQYPRVGVIATAATTLNPSTRLLENMATQLGTPTEVVPRYCEGAFEALFAGDLDRHDAIVMKHLETLMKEVDAVLLAQASMARVVRKLDFCKDSISIETSPRWALRHLAGLIG